MQVIWEFIEFLSRAKIHKKRKKNGHENPNKDAKSIIQFCYVKK